MDTATKFQAHHALQSIASKHGGPIDGAVHVGESFAASGLRFATTLLYPLRLLELASAFAQGNGASGLADLIINTVDGPL